jgi:hypothetical protein
VVALLGGVIVLFQTEALWDMTSSNAVSWNATLNGSMTSGVNITPIFVIVIVAAVICGAVSVCRGF